MIALTSDQKLIIAVLVLVLVVYILVDWYLTMTRDPPLPRSTRKLKHEIEKHPSDFEED